MTSPTAGNSGILSANPTSSPSEIDAMIDGLEAVDPRPSVADLVSALEASIDRSDRRDLALHSTRFASGSIFADAAARAIAANTAIVWG